MGGGDSTASKVMEDEEDLRSDGCRSDKLEILCSSWWYVVAAEGCQQQKKCSHVSGDWHPLRKTWREKTVTFPF